MELTITFFIKFTLVACFVLALNYILRLIRHHDKLGYTSHLEFLSKFIFSNFLFLSFPFRRVC
ncbi:hypothetical protein FLCH110379_08260 [Flavobacterium chungbukense]